MNATLLRAIIATSLSAIGTLPAFAVTLNDLKPRYVPSETRPDLARPLPPALPVQSRPQVSVGQGNTFGVAPTLTVPMRNGGQFEFKGPDLHPQVPPSLNGGSVSITIPLPAGTK